MESINVPKSCILSSNATFVILLPLESCEGRPLESGVHQNVNVSGIIISEQCRRDLGGTIRYDTIEEFNVDSKAEYSNYTG